MKFEVAQCLQCGEAFNRTNLRKEYCRGACRVAAHRERHGYQMPIFDKEQSRLVEQIAQIPLRDFEHLMRDAIRYRIFFEFYERELGYFNFHENTLFQEVYGKIETEENESGAVYLDAINSVNFMYPLNELLEYAEENSINLFKKGNL